MKLMPLSKIIRFVMMQDVNVSRTIMKQINFIFECGLKSESDCPSAWAKICDCVKGISIVNPKTEAKNDGNDDSLSDSEMIDINDSKLEDFVEDTQTQYGLLKEISDAINVNILYAFTFKMLYMN